MVTPLESGKLNHSYFGSIVKNLSGIHLLNNPSAVRVPAIHVNSFANLSAHTLGHTLSANSIASRGTASLRIINNDADSVADRKSVASQTELIIQSNERTQTDEITVMASVGSGLFTRETSAQTEAEHMTAELRDAKQAESNYYMECAESMLADIEAKAFDHIIQVSSVSNALRDSTDAYNYTNQINGYVNSERRYSPKTIKRRKYLESEIMLGHYEQTEANHLSRSGISDSANVPVVVLCNFDNYSVVEMARDASEYAFENQLRAQSLRLNYKFSRSRTDLASIPLKFRATNWFHHWFNS